MEDVWGSPIWIYLWLAGMGGGAYFTAFLAHRFSGGVHKSLLKIATYLAVPLAGLGVLLLIIDLGRPLRFWRLMTKFDFVSAMSIGTWILSAFVALCVVLIALWWWTERSKDGHPKEKGILHKTAEVLSWINLGMAVLLITYTGVLLASSSQVLWSGTLLLPPLFVVSAISTGAAILIVTSIVAGKEKISESLVTKLSNADAIVIVIEMALIIGFLGWLGISTAAGTTEAMRLLVMDDSVAVVFWIGVVLLALLIPLVLELRYWNHIKENASIIRRAEITSGVAVMIGGLALRAVVVTAGQILI